MTTPNVQMLRDLVLIRPKPLTLNKSTGGVILPGDVDKMAPKRATVIAAGPGTYDKNGKLVKNTCEAGDQVLYMERNVTPVKIDGEEFFVIPNSEVILRIGKNRSDPIMSLPEMPDAVYHAETLRRTLIKHLQACGLTRVQDMLNPVEIYTMVDGSDTLSITAKSFMLESVDSILEFTPPDDAKAFAMYHVNYVEANDGIAPEVRVVARVAFLPRADVTLG